MISYMEAFGILSSAIQYLKRREPLGTNSAIYILVEKQRDCLDAWRAESKNK